MHKKLSWSPDLLSLASGEVPFTILKTGDTRNQTDRQTPDRSEYKVRPRLKKMYISVKKVRNFCYDWFGSMPLPLITTLCLLYICGTARQGFIMCVYKNLIWYYMIYITIIILLLS